MSLYMILVTFFIYLLAFGRGGQVPEAWDSICKKRSGNYTSNSTYDVNLNALLDSLPSKMSDYGFHVSSLGLLKQDRAYVLALYRGDQTPDQCRACVEATSHKILQVCPNKQ
ncbi:hypothetical protein ACS0TY_005843 [Phlomoides rotata]